MGGVPWTSKACKNCKTSKVKCDLQEPQCARCIRRRIPCPGYEARPFIITTFQPGNPKPISTNLALKRAVTRMQPTKMLQVINSGPAKRVQISSTYINLWFPMDTPQISGIDRWFGKDSWYQIFTHIQQIPNKSPMLERAIAAVSFVCLGKFYHDEALVEQGVWWYNSSIRHLLRMMQRKDLSEETIFSTVIFQFLELWHSPYGMEAFVAHVNGTNACIKKLTKSQASMPAMKLLARDQRRLSILSLVLTDEIKYSAQAEQLSEEDSTLDELFYFLAPVSNLVSESNAVENSDWQAAKRILYATLGYREEILSWYARRKDDIGLPFHPPRKALATDQNYPHHIFGTPYSFLNFESAALHVLYWTGLIIVEGLIQKTQTNLSLWSNGEKLTDYSGHHVGLEVPEFYADEICRSIPYCLSGASGAWGMNTLIGLFIEVVKPYIALRRKAKLDYCLDIYRLAVNRGIGIAASFTDWILLMWEASNPPTEKSLRSKHLTSPTTTRDVSQDNDEDLESFGKGEISNKQSVLPRPVG